MHKSRKRGQPQCNARPARADKRRQPAGAAVQHANQDGDGHRGRRNAQNER